MHFKISLRPVEVMELVLNIVTAVGDRRSGKMLITTATVAIADEE
jgi:hypothetical protein